MEKAQFESAVIAAVSAESQNSRKWKPLERLFAADGIRASGALFNENKQGGNRAQQLFDGTRKHGGFATVGFNKHSVVVFAADSARHLVDDPTYLNTRWVPEIEENRPSSLPPELSADSALLLRADVVNGGIKLIPLTLLEWQASPVTAQYKAWYPGLPVVVRESAAFPQPGPAAPAVAPAPVPANDVARNVILSGPPGVGKSYAVTSITAGYTVFRTTFHPEMTHGQFVGEYKVVVGEDSDATITGYDGQTRPRPVSYFSYEPSHLIQALAYACLNPTESVGLIIEEINRGDCAAIFGDFFQLLDRDSTGASEYPIHVSPALAAHLHSRGVIPSVEAAVALPCNLFLFATMNTSDQSLYPMDAAFKRRWDWRTVKVMEGAEKLKDVLVEHVGSSVPLRWVDLVVVLNDRIMAFGHEDKRIGPWYLKSYSNAISASQIREKLLHYLWHDVFRVRRQDLFAPSLRTFDEVQELFDSVGLLAVMPALLAERDEMRTLDTAAGHNAAPEPTSDP